MAARECIDLECFLVTKHSWKGKYKRILSIGSNAVSTYNLDKFDLTNRWHYNEVVSVMPNKTGNTAYEFVLNLRKDKKIDTIKLSSEYRNEILTSLLRYYKEFADKPKHILDDVECPTESYQSAFPSTASVRLNNWIRMLVSSLLLQPGVSECLPCCELESYKFDAFKHHWSGTTLPAVLEVTPCSLDQLDPTTNTVLASYNYKDIDSVIGIQDYTDGIVLAYGGHSRLHLFRVQNHHDVVQMIVNNAQQYLGIDIKVRKNQITLDQFERERFGSYGGDQHQTSLSEFIVQKITPRHSEPMRRILCLTDTTILERDPQTYSVCTLRPLIEIFALIRYDENIQKFSIEYKNGLTRSYLTNDRDSLLATLLDSVRSCGNQDVHVRISRTPRGKRVGPLTAPVDEETEANLLRYIISCYQYPVKRLDVLERFNANIPYSGLNYSVTQESLFSENKERLITGALQALVGGGSKEDLNQLNNVDLEASFHVLRRLLASKVGFAAFTNLPGFRETIGFRVVHALKRNNLAVTYAAIDMINSLMHPMHAEYELKQEQMNKSSLLHSKGFLEQLLDMWTKHVNLGSGALVLSAMLDFLTFALCVPYSETTDGKQFDMLLEMVATRGRTLYKLFQHPSLAIVKGSGLVMRALIEEGDTTISNQMQSLALDEAALCHHLLVALYTPSHDSTMATHRQLSRHLVGLWITDSKDAMNLLRRIFPAGLLSFLESEDPVPKEDVEEDKLNFRDNLKLAVQHSSKNKRLNYLIEKHLEGIKHWGLNLIDRQEKIQQSQKNRPIVLRNRRQKKKVGDEIVNLPLFFYQFNKNHAMPNLIWNLKTREELRAALENEIRQFNADKDLAGSMVVAWNYEEFEVQYQCLADEIKIGDYYIRLLLERDDWPQNLVKNPMELFNALYRRVLCRNRLNDDQLTVTSLQALAKVYKRYYENIGYFSDITYILQMLDRCLSPALRDALVGLIKNLVLHKSNCRPLVDHVNCLVDLVTLAHMHTGRAMPNTKTNVIEAGPNMKLHEEKDWYYNVERDNEKPERCGPVTFSELKELWNKGGLTPRTRCWAVGMDGWRSLQQIPQLKWCLMAKGSPLYNETELAQHVLDILIKCTSFFPSRARDGEAVLIPGPRLSRKLSEFICLPHIVQVCLTHDPGLLERVASLLCQIMEDNPEMSKVYLTGVFYFMLMYTGSNILPIARFLKMTHMKQAFRSEETNSQSGIMHRSILGQLLPEAMVCYLENHSAEKFAETFLGEFDTPEVIWSSEMRRMLIEKISAHIADFTPKLKGHTMARYPYLAIPVISYPQLENELFCHIFYLRHLCDTRKFPNWPIPDPVQLLKHTLDAWRKEVEKKPSQMTVTQAYEDLGIDLVKNPQPDESVIRKSYYRLAQMYHPDKNPKGREIFERVNRAYEFLCSRRSTNDGPNPGNIVLILRTQSILFDRYADVLRPYKYAGYPQLIKTIQLETKDEQLFSKTVPLLSAASELCYHTVHCSALNAEELRREEGIEALLEAYSRCVSIMGVDSQKDSLHYEVISNITRCFEVACRFENCRKKILELPQLIVDVCRVVYFKHSLSVSLVTSLAANNYDLQCNLVRNGVLWSLMIFMFDYDYTLDESGVVTDEKSNNQQASNNLAKLSLLACVALAGYHMTLLDEDSSLVPGKTAPKSNPISRSDSPQQPTAPRSNSLTQTQPYTQNASNLIQNNSSLIQSVATFDRTLSERSESLTSTTAMESTEPVECEKGINNKYKISSAAPTNMIVKKMLDKLLTMFVANKMVSDNETEVLKLLSSNTRNPYLIWDNGTRAQLLDFLEFQRSNASRQQYDNIADVYELVKNFSYDAHRDELKIGGIFIRIYNEMPSFPIANPKSFVMDLLEFLKQAFNYLTAKNIRPIPPPASVNNVNSQGILIPTKTWKPLVPTKTSSNPVNSNVINNNNNNNINNHRSTANQLQKQQDISAVLSEYSRAKQRSQLARTDPSTSDESSKLYDFASNPNAINHIVMALKALIAVIKSNSNVEIQCIGHFEMLFGFLSSSLCDRDKILKSLSLEVVCLVSRNKECVTEISACEIFGLYLVALKDKDLRDVQQKVLETLSGLLNVPKMVKEGHSKGAVIYLLDLFCNSNNPQIRESCAELLSKMNADKLSGPKIRITVCKYLPSVFLDAMIDSPSVAVQMYESTHEHPELIWNDRIRSTVSDAVHDMADSFYMQQKQNSKTLWRDPEVLPEIISNELVVSGVYLRLYISNPGWTLRKPKQFLSDLLDFIVDNISRNGVDKNVLDISTNALVLLLNAQPNLADSVPVLGHIPKFFRQLSVQPRSALTVLHQLSLSEICVSAISQTDCILALKSCMESHRELLAAASETLSRLFKCQHDSLIRQSLECQLIPFLLGLLESRIDSTTNPAMVKAQIVAALKAMTSNLTYGDRVAHILNQNPVWAEYRDQKHDLFITDTNVRGYLTGAPNTTAGYLTQGPAKNVEVLTSPPPMDRDDPLFVRSSSNDA
ncbi:dnaJ homolog subfamily C member 13 isoform X1 [Wyeomyia smithii]|uniref:dnaJ homolog subfamily C member 13 isoform X1 n=1 Tax=Wyeomyia smithii TaxID=174621 RepID=UPI00246809E6|nr:dnaJ homolog subfamily C member 13 isoform X1 [Wyeomyia smithii]XP_055532842.1 dnaJ homolog subfamily C member 13 isoform X1 [Wyeomyia smithii]